MSRMHLDLGSHHHYIVQGHTAKGAVLGGLEACTDRDKQQDLLELKEVLAPAMPGGAMQQCPSRSRCMQTDLLSSTLPVLEHSNPIGHALACSRASWLMLHADEGQSTEPGSSALWLSCAGFPSLHAAVWSHLTPPCSRKARRPDTRSARRALSYKSLAAARKLAMSRTVLVPPRASRRCTAPRNS